ncbi:MAG: ribosomal RNA small subunit methyltransferase A [Chloroflexi bacterium]|nr:ribosomal RNA small subunit methyltransferase A [Chloroflexota bacterium]
MPNLEPLNVPALLRQYGLRPAKGLGQNFLVDELALADVIAAAEVSPEDRVLEVGPGLGSLTRHLASIAQRVVAVELDRKLLEPLKEILAPYPNVELVHKDILEVDPAAHFEAPGYLVVANIPYYITSALIRHLLEASLQPARLTLTVQQEVAHRICAEPGKMSRLALSVQVYGQPSIAARIPARAFYPAPKVDSAVVRVEIFPQPILPKASLDDFFRLAKAGFSQKRKTLRNSLAAGMGWPKDRAISILKASDIDPQRRAQTLSLEEWGRLVDEVG